MIQKNNAEYIVRGVGWLQGQEDIEAGKVSGSRKGVSDGLKDGQYLIQKSIFEFLSMVHRGSLGPPDFKKSVESAAVDFLRHDSDVQWLRANTVSDRMAMPGDNGGGLCWEATCQGFTKSMVCQGRMALSSSP